MTVWKLTLETWHEPEQSAIQGSLGEVRAHVTTIRVAWDPHPPSYDSEPETFPTSIGQLQIVSRTPRPIAFTSTESFSLSG
jgi:hypothetical protein